MKKLLSGIDRYKSSLMLGTALLSIALIEYWSIISNALIGDDYGIRDKVSHIQFMELWQLFSVLQSYMRPLPLLYWWTQYQFFGESGWQLHLFNIVFHAGNAFLLFCLLKKLRFSGISSAFASILFVSMPIAPEVVAWPAASYDLFALFFMQLTLILYLSFLEKGKSGFYLGSLVCFIAALLSKEVSVTLMVILPSMDLLLRGIFGSEDYKNPIINRVILKSLAKHMFPFMLSLLTIFTVRTAQGYHDSPPAIFPFLTLRGTARTFWTILSPMNEAIFNSKETNIIGGLVFFLFLLSVISIIYYWKNKPSSYKRSMIFLAVYFVASLIPINFWVFYYGFSHSLQDSRYLYISMASLISIFAVGVTEFGMHGRIRKSLCYGIIVITVTFSVIGVINNNKPWQAAEEICLYVPEETRRLLPEPHPGAQLYFKDVPMWKSAQVFMGEKALSIAIKSVYKREDINIHTLSSEEQPPDSDNSYLFVYDPTSSQLKLEQHRNY